MPCVTWSKSEIWTPLQHLVPTCRVETRRLFWSEDQRFLKQFRAGDLGSRFKPYSKFPPCYKVRTSPVASVHSIMLGGGNTIGCWLCGIVSACSAPKPTLRAMLTCSVRHLLQDVSFWTSEGFTENNLCEVVRGIAGKRSSFE